MKKEKTIAVTLNLEVDRNEFTASRLIGSDIDPAFRGVDKLSTKEWNDLVWATVKSTVSDLLSDMLHSITLNED